MHTPIAQLRENHIQPAANSFSIQKKVNTTPFQLQPFQEMADNSSQVKQSLQLQSIADRYAVSQQQPLQKKANHTGLPDGLKSGIEGLSGYSMDDVKVHYGSDKPAQLQAHAYAQGTDIHLGPGQEKHLAHEAWHVVQQKQGRVKPTLQLKGNVNVNDNHTLEQEADLMGAKALQRKTNTTTFIKTQWAQGVNVVQRAININAVPQSISKVYDDLLIKVPKWREDDMRLSLLHGLLPAYHAMDKTVVNIDQLVEEISRILPNYHYLYEVGNYGDLHHYINNQKVIQERVKANKAWYEGLITTVGFEHEFADMKDSPLAGVSHMEIAKSTEGLPYTGIKFLVETDAANALELVSPPFLFPTTKGSTIPKSDAVSTVDNLMKWALVTILTTRKSKWLPDIYLNRTYIEQSLEALMLKLSAITGFTFQLNNNIEIKPGYLSHNTNLATLKDHVSAAGNKITLNQESLKNIHVGKSEKGSSESYSISSQVNFATDMQTASRLNMQSGLGGTYTGIFRTIETALRGYISVPVGGSAGLTAFYPIMIGKLASLFSVYSQNHVRNAQQELHGDLVAKATPLAPDRNLGLPNPAAKREFNMHSLLMSYVKDVTPAWIKDHVLSIAKGMLQADDYPILLRSLKAANFAGFDVPGEITDAFRDSSHSDLAAHWLHFKTELITAVDDLKLKIEHIIIPNGSSVFMDKKPDVGLYGHDEDYVGARQDTYQNPKHIQMPEIHHKRLHVVEIRRGDPSKKLSELESDL